MMGLNRNYLQLATTIALLGSPILSGCKDSGQSPVRLAKGSGDAREAAKQERYTPEQKKLITDITQFESYEKNLKPLLETLSVQTQNNLWKQSPLIKKWLFSPNELNGEDSRVMAVHMMTEQDDTLSIQTNQDIWVQSALFKDLSGEDQAEFILTETLTSLYLIRNLTDQELCFLVYETFPNVTCKFITPKENEDEDAGKESAAAASEEKNAQQVQEQIVSKPNVKKPETERSALSYREKRRMNEVDYQRVRLAKAFLTTTKGLTRSKVEKKLTELNFDSRLFQIVFP